MRAHQLVLTVIVLTCLQSAVAALADDVCARFGGTLHPQYDGEFHTDALINIRQLSRNAYVTNVCFV
jgi:hypothetical protein